MNYEVFKLKFCVWSRVGAWRTLRAKRHWFWRRSSRRTVIISNFSKRLNLVSNTCSRSTSELTARFSAWTAWMASMLRFLPLWRGFLFLLLSLIVMLIIPLPVFRELGKKRVIGFSLNKGSASTSIWIAVVQFIVGTLQRALSSTPFQLSSLPRMLG